MKLTIRGEEDIEQELELYLDRGHAGHVRLRGRDMKGIDWTIVRLLPDGTIERTAGLPNDIGLQLEKHGRIMESE